MPCFAKPFAFWILICLLLLLQLFKLLWMGIKSSVCLDLPQNGHAQASFGVQGFQYHTKVTAVDFIDIQSSMCGSIYQISSQTAACPVLPTNKSLFRPHTPRHSQPSPLTVWGGVWHPPDRPTPSCTWTDGCLGPQVADSGSLSHSSGAQPRAMAVEA